MSFWGKWNSHEPLMIVDNWNFKQSNKTKNWTTTTKKKKWQLVYNQAVKGSTGRPKSNIIFVTKKTIKVFWSYFDNCMNYAKRPTNAWQKWDKRQHEVSTNWLFTHHSWCSDVWEKIFTSTVLYSLSIHFFSFKGECLHVSFKTYVMPQ